MDQNNKDLIKCPCCGEQTFPKHAQLNQQIFDVFMACVLSQKPFTYTYSLFKDSINITCSEPTASQIDKISKLGRRIQELKDDKLKDLYKNVLFRLSAVWPLVSISINKKDEQKVYNIKDTLQELYKKLSEHEITEELLTGVNNTLNDASKLSSVPTLIINKVLDTHASNAQLLTTVGFDQDFYKGIPHI